MTQTITPRIVTVRQGILKKNDELALENRQKFLERVWNSPAQHIG